ncbi:MAG: beta-1,6-N-acetylglucosaminyltransferase [Chlorobiaceae bacterium]|nr:beta-1,6-N-acetylglucosaminyltransferase [Chlorobiaceae bacterium]
MKQGILVTAFKEPEWLERVIIRLSGEFSFFIHVDAKSSREVREGFHALACKYENVAVFSNYKVNWGGNNHLKAILLLVEKALESGTGYCHLITGQDYPIKSSDFLIGEGLKGVNYLHSLPLPRDDWKDGGYDRLVYYNFFDLFDGRTRWGRRMIHYLVGIQRILSYKRGIPANLKLFCGNTYWSLDRECLEYAMGYAAAHPAFMKQFNHSFCSEEFFFQTVLMNSPFKEKIVNDDRRFIVWEFRDGSNPANLDQRDVEQVLASPAYFMRKISYPESASLVDAVDHMVHGR